VSERVIDDIENGNRSNYLDATLAAIEAALGWAPGTCLRVVQGGRVRREHDPLLVRFLDAWRALPTEARELLVLMAEQAAGRRHD
jgi:hypothetical protein